jgi:MFS family permease
MQAARTRAEASAAPGGGRLLRALRHRNYRLFVSGQGISLIGTWLQQVALSWLVFRLTNSAVLLGVVGFADQIPTFLLAPVAGVMTDRWDRRRLLILTQSLAMIQAGILGLLVLSHQVQVWHVMLLATMLGLVNAFDMPGRQSFVVQMIEDRADLPNAIALNSSMVNAARLVGPAVAGALLASVGEAWCFLINAASYIAVIISLVLIRVEPSAPASGSQPNLLASFREGAAYAFGSPPIRAILLLLAVMSLLAMPYSVLMPIYATRILHGNAITQGWLMAASGVGALAGALYLASRQTVLGLGRIITGGAFLFGAALIAFGFSHWLPLSLLILPFVGLGMMVQMAGSNTILQTIVTEEKRGRVMSFYSMAFLGMAPFGSLLAGTLSSRIGPSWTVSLGGFCALIAALYFSRMLPRLREAVRPIYVEKGILPEAAVGVSNATELTRPPEQR